MFSISRQKSYMRKKKKKKKKKISKNTNDNTTLYNIWNNKNNNNAAKTRDVRSGKTKTKITGYKLETQDKRQLVSYPLVAGRKGY